MAPLASGKATAPSELGYSTWSSLLLGQGHGGEVLPEATQHSSARMSLDLGVELEREGRGGHPA